jgi:hypothetical protein
LNASVRAFVFFHRTARISIRSNWRLRS